MKSRHRAREIALQMLYQYDLVSNGTPKPVLPESELASELMRHYDHFRVDAELREFIGQLVAGTLTHISVLDELLEKHASHWKVARMSAVDRSILRLAAYEMVFLKEVAPSIVIDEAIELSKGYGTSESSAFINGILDGILSAVKNLPPLLPL